MCSCVVLEEVGSVVTSRALYHAACEFGMISMLVTSKWFSKHVEIMRSLECCTTPFNSGERRLASCRIGRLILVLIFQFSVVWVPSPSDDSCGRI